MFKEFYDSFQDKKNGNGSAKVYSNQEKTNHCKILLDSFGGSVFENGLYCIYTPSDSIMWAKLLNKYFKRSDDFFMPFGYDWMGRQFCISLTSVERVFMVDPATFEVFEVEEDIVFFHNTTLPNSKVQVLASDLFEQTLEFLSLKSIQYGSCLGFNVPLFLGGTEEISNYSLWDMELYWEMSFQLFEQTTKLPPGTAINTINIEI